MTDTPTYAQLVECAQREVKQRERVYPRRVSNGQMTQDLADRELARMRRIVVVLEHVTTIMADAVEAQAEELSVTFHGAKVEAGRCASLSDSASTALDELLPDPAAEGRLL